MSKYILLVIVILLVVYIGLEDKAVRCSGQVNTVNIQEALSTGGLILE